MYRRGYHSRTPVAMVDSARTEEHEPVCNVDVIKFVFTRGFVFRFNHEFRSRINHKVLLLPWTKLPWWSGSDQDSRFS